MNRPHLVIVDDSPTNLQILMRALGSEYRMTPFSRTLEALGYLDKHPNVDLILMDIDMPELSGFETFAKIKRMPALARVPVIFVTARTDVESEISAFDIGIVDYIKKPIVPAIAKKRIDFQIQSRRREQRILDESDTIKKLTEVTIKTVIALVDRFEEEPEGHIERVMAYVTLLAETLRERGDFPGQIDDAFVLKLRLSAPFHDCGKAYIEGSILGKPGTLDSEEYREMQRHAALGSHVMRRARDMMGEPSFFDEAERMVLCCHERWDGKGYPDGIAGDGIPLSARIMALADVYDALIRNKPYKKAIPHEQAVRTVMAERGGAFDPTVCDAFLHVADQFEQIAACE